MKKTLINILCSLISIFLSIIPAHAAQQNVQQNVKLSPTEIFQKYSDCVVTIFKEGETNGTGSGFFIEGTGGLILTNYHVVKDAKSLTVRIKGGNTFEVDKIVAEDARRDLALLALNVKSKNIPALKIAETLPEIGSTVVAIGSPFGLTESLSDGVLSAVRKDDEINIIQFTAPISPGSSGSPIFNEYGEVIGIATWVRVNSQNINIGADQSEITGFLKELPKLSEQQYIREKRDKDTGNARKYKMATVSSFIFKAGNYKEGRVLTLKKPIKSTIPGLLGVHFWFEITEPCNLVYKYTSSKGVEFYVPEDLSLMRSHLAGMSQIAAGDSLGVYIDKDNNFGWYVDNTKANLGMPTIWMRPFKKNEKNTYIEEVSTVYVSDTEEAFVIHLRNVDEKGIYLVMTSFFYGDRKNEIIRIPENEIPGEFDILDGVLDIDRIEGDKIYYDWIKEPMSEGNKDIITIKRK